MSTETETIYYYSLDVETGKITRYEINNYVCYPKYCGGGDYYTFDGVLGGKQPYHHRFHEEDFDKVNRKRIFTFNPSYEYAYKKFMDYYEKRRDEAYQEAENMAGICDILKNNKL